MKRITQKTEPAFIDQQKQMDELEPMNLIKSGVMELFGTFFLVYFGGLSVMAMGGGAAGYSSPTLPGVAFTHCCILCIMICIGGPISGAQYNPAVSLGLMAILKLHWMKGLINIVAQIIASFLAALLLKIFLPDDLEDGGLGYPKMPDPPMTAIKILIYETFGTFILVLVITCGVLTNKPAQVIGVYVGVTLLVCINGFGFFTGTSLNPARTLGPSLLSGGTDDGITRSGFWGYYLGNIVGGVLGAVVGRYLFYPEDVPAPNMRENAKYGKTNTEDHPLN